MRIKVVERDVTVTLTSERRRPTHSGTGDGAGRGVAMDDYREQEMGPLVLTSSVFFVFQEVNLIWDHVVLSKQNRDLVLNVNDYAIC
jgi:hypothetical protein